MSQPEKPKKSYNELPAKEIAAPAIVPAKAATPIVTQNVLIPTIFAAPPAPAAPVASPSAVTRFDEMQRVLRQRIIRNLTGKYVEGGDSKLEIYFEGGHILTIEGNFKFKFSR